MNTIEAQLSSVTMYKAHEEIVCDGYQELLLQSGPGPRNWERSTVTNRHNRVEPPTFPGPDFIFDG
jgi:hypothetical protein